MNAFDVSEHWYKAVLAAGVVLAGAAVAVGHNPLLICGLGLVLWGIGEFINHPYQEKLVMNDYGSVNAKISGRPWQPNPFGLVLDAIGGILLVIGLVKVLLT